MPLPLNLRTGPRMRRLPTAKIAPNPYQPRKVFDREGMNDLARSIARYGVITPLTVKRSGEGYTLISGERRLRASIMAGLTAVPCYIIEADEEETSAMALVENLQRRDLDPFEEAQGIQRLTVDFGLTQQQAAELLGKTQAAVANKLRLLKLGPETMEIMRKHGLTERHGRALLALTDLREQAEAAEYIGQKGLTVARAEEYISRLLAQKEAPKPVKQAYIKDIRFFLNSISKAVDTIKNAGVQAKCTRTDKGEDILLEIVIHKNALPFGEGAPQGQERS